MSGKLPNDSQRKTLRAPSTRYRVFLRSWLSAAAFMLVFSNLCAWASAQEAVEKTTESGPVQVVVRLEPAKPLIGDVVTLTITVKAEKHVEVLMPEFGDALERYSILDFAPRQSINDDGKTVGVQKYRLQPPSSGRQAIPPILIEYVDRREGQREAPEGMDAYELLTERLEFEVQSVVPSDAKADLRPPLGKLTSRAAAGTGVGLWLAGALVILAVASPFALRAYLRRRRRTRRKTAYQIARSQLDRLLARPRPTVELVDAFFVELSGIVRRYLEDRFELRAPELTTEEFLVSAGGLSDLSQTHQALLREFLRQADLVKFAGIRPDGDDINRSIEVAGRFLEETREDATVTDTAPQQGPVISNAKA